MNSSSWRANIPKLIKLGGSTSSYLVFVTMPNFSAWGVLLHRLHFLSVAAATGERI